MVYEDIRPTTTTFRGPAGEWPSAFSGEVLRTRALCSCSEAGGAGDERGEGLPEPAGFEGEEWVKPVDSPYA